MDSAGIERRIFVVGVPRSGTTLVQSLLAAHSEVVSFTESHFFSQHFKPVRRGRFVVLTRDPAPRLREFLGENDVDPVTAAAVERVAPLVFSGAGRARDSRVSRLLLALQTRAVGRQFLQALDVMTTGRGRSSWVEKTPQHLRFIPFVERLSMDPAGRRRTFFVHVIRAGLDTVASLHRASAKWELPYDLETCAQRWNEDVAFSLSRLGKPNDLFVFYEELTSRPEAALQRLLAGLSLVWEGEILRGYGEAAQRLITPQETWKSSVSGPLHRSRRSLRTLTGEQRRKVDRMLRHDLYSELLEATA